VSKLGTGGTAKCKLGYDMQTNTQVAIKIMNVPDDEHKKMLMDEVKAASAVNHPNLLSIRDYGEGVKVNTRGETKKVLFIVLELCLKESLFDFVT